MRDDIIRSIRESGFDPNGYDIDKIERSLRKQGCRSIEDVDAETYWTAVAAADLSD